MKEDPSEHIANILKEYFKLLDKLTRQKTVKLKEYREITSECQEALANYKQLNIVMVRLFFTLTALDNVIGSLRVLEIPNENLIKEWKELDKRLRMLVSKHSSKFTNVIFVDFQKTASN